MENKHTYIIADMEDNRVDEFSTLFEAISKARDLQTFGKIGDCRIIIKIEIVELTKKK